MSLTTVAVLCCQQKSVYHSMPAVECYDVKRDARTFTGGMPIVAHPPCRAWSAYCAHQAKPEPGEKELGPLCVKWLHECGGILEHPAHSRLFDACGLPKPGEHRVDCWTAEVSQSWWGDSRTKTTWLCFFRIAPKQVQWPITLHEPAGDRRRWQLMSKNQRSKTTRELGEWLVGTARKTNRGNAR